MTHSSLQVFRRGKPQTETPIALWGVVSDHLDSTLNQWNYLNRVGRVPHLLWNPLTDNVWEGVPISHAGTVWPVVGAVQVLIMASPEDSLTGHPLYGSETVAEALNDWGVPSLWPAGPAPFYGPLRGLQRAKPGNYPAQYFNPEWEGLFGMDLRRIHGTYAH